MSYLFIKNRHLTFSCYIFRYRRLDSSIAAQKDILHRAQLQLARFQVSPFRLIYLLSASYTCFDNSSGKEFNIFANRLDILSFGEMLLKFDKTEARTTSQGYTCTEIV